jgi:hypothetical protein
MKKRSAAVSAAFLGLIFAGYPALWRKRCLTWGATTVEAAREMPGDRFLPGAELVATRAVTIEAPPEAVWPWLVQMGPHRGGAYTYDWIENLLGLKMHSADEILPEYQNLKVGDPIPLGKNGPRMRVEVLEPASALVLHSEDDAWVWEFGLYPEGDGTTRLVSRNRISEPHPNPLTKAFSMYIMEPGSLIMERKMLLGIKERAERLAGELDTDTDAG